MALQQARASAPELVNGPESGEAVSDEKLVAQTREGDLAAFDVLVRRHLNRAYALALGLVGNASDAEDVCQDAFIKCLERIHECRHPERFGAWLLRIVRNQSLNQRKYFKVRNTVALEEDQVRSTANPSRDAERSQLRADLLEALMSLKEVQREVVLLHDYEGWTHREIAEELSVSELMSRQHLFHARRTLRALLGDHFFRAEAADDK